jgi:hypothetical protein
MAKNDEASDDAACFHRQDLIHQVGIKFGFRTKEDGGGLACNGCASRLQTVARNPPPPPRGGEGCARFRIDPSQSLDQNPGIDSHSH